MRNIFLIARRELLSCFVSPIAYIIVSSFLFCAVYFFIGTTFTERSTDLSGVFANLAILVFMICPFMSMRLFSEEKKNGTIELLFTSPIDIMQIVIGKYFAALAIFCIMLAITLLYPLFLQIMSGVYWPKVLLHYLGIFLVGSAVLGIGLVCSALTENQIVAGILGVAISLSLLLISWISNQTTGVLRAVIDEITIMAHYQSFLKGIFDVRDIVYFMAWILFSLFLSAKILESGKWRN